MLAKLKALLTPATTETGDELSDEQRLRIATAALLVEMSRADFSENDTERDEISRVLQRHFSLEVEEAGALLTRAADEADASVSLHEFTSLLHNNLDVSEKQRIVEMLWRVALADAELDKHEDYLVRKISELLYLPHSDLMRLKHRVLGELDTGDA